MTYPGFEHMPWRAEVVALDEPRLFSFRWPHMDEQQKVREDWSWAVVEFRLEPTDAGTRLTVTESGFDALPPERRDAAYRSNDGGWEEQMGNIKARSEEHPSELQSLKRNSYADVCSKKKMQTD